MGWKAIHRWLGLVAGSIAVLLGLTGALLAIDPVQQAWQAPAAAPDLSTAALVERMQDAMPGPEKSAACHPVPSSPSASMASRPRRFYVDLRDGRALAAYRPSQLPRWVKNLHRSLLLGMPALGCRGTALAMALISISGLVLMLRRMGAWRHRPARCAVRRRSACTCWSNGCCCWCCA